MCGIFGFVNLNHSFDFNFQKKLLNHFFKISEIRGKDASGLAYVADNKVHIIKSNLSGSKLIKNQDFKTLVDSLQNSQHLHGFIGHTRLVTNGDESDHLNNQPIVCKTMVGVHNGIILNDKLLWQQNPHLTQKTQNDSEVIFKLLENYENEFTDNLYIRKKLFENLEGSASIAAFNLKKNEMMLASNTGSLYYILTKDFLIFASESIFLKKITKFFSRNDLTIIKIEPHEGLIQKISQDESLSTFSIHEHPVISRISNTKGFQIKSLSSNHFKINNKIHQSFEEIKRDVDSLKRCSQCILPETMPFISFNNLGVCNFCLNHQPIQHHSIEQLKTKLKPHKRNTKADSIVAFSGGRDSCYALHYVKKELGLNPIAYTYDWGMVTDVARRNQSKLCGQLGVEHIIVSADIRKKRENIAKNIQAWLKRPQLGIVPLFMAGDKQFYYYANKIAKDYQTDLIFFGIGNELENTNFKVGFSGISKDSNAGVLTNISFANKMKMLSFYLKEFLINPSYLNSSVFDNAFAFFSSYFLKHDYICLFHYEPWEEEKIMGLLAQEYGWETAQDSKSTWRIGDGTAAFYNYLYYIYAGFTENDTFRSNQIRAGKISRELALEQVMLENIPRYDSISQYLDILGLNSENVLETLHQHENIKKSYLQQYLKSY